MKNYYEHETKVKFSDGLLRLSKGCDFSERGACPLRKIKYCIFEKIWYN